ncbi:MAG TPA: PIN domain-containing protein [Blastocatellia bacterium]|nr:PIN domain-containing protein [Blastocatellia bacterium]
MRVLLDTDVVLDLVLDRQPFVTEATSIWELNYQGEIEAYVSAITPINVFYVTRKNKGLQAAHSAVEKLLVGLGACTIDAAVLHNARALPFADYEDAVQCAAAIAAGLDAIVTRNVADYKAATIPVYLPVDFLSKVSPAQ